MPHERADPYATKDANPRTSTTSEITAVSIMTVAAAILIRACSASTDSMCCHMGAPFADFLALLRTNQ